MSSHSWLFTTSRLSLKLLCFASDLYWFAQKCGIAAAVISAAENRSSGGAGASAGSSLKPGPVGLNQRTSPRRGLPAAPGASSSSAAASAFSPSGAAAIKSAGPPAGATGSSTSVAAAIAAANQTHVNDPFSSFAAARSAVQAAPVGALGGGLNRAGSAGASTASPPSPQGAPHGYGPVHGRKSITAASGDPAGVSYLAGMNKQAGPSKSPSNAGPSPMNAGLRSRLAEAADDQGANSSDEDAPGQAASGAAPELDEEDSDGSDENPFAPKRGGEPDPDQAGAEDDGPSAFDDAELEVRSKNPSGGQVLSSSPAPPSVFARGAAAPPLANASAGGAAGRGPPPPPKGQPPGRNVPHRLPPKPPASAAPGFASPPPSNAGHHPYGAAAAAQAPPVIPVLAGLRGSAPPIPAGMMAPMGMAPGAGGAPSPRTVATANMAAASSSPLLVPPGKRFSNMLIHQVGERGPHVHHACIMQQLDCR